MSKARQLSSFNKQLLSDGRIVSTALGPGSVIQVISNKSSAQPGSTTASWTPTGISATITPKSLSNKIRVEMNGMCGGSTWFAIGCFRDTYLIPDLYCEPQADYSWLGSNFQFSLDFLDTITSLNAVTYQVAFFATGTVYINRNPYGASFQSGAMGTTTVTLTEIAQ